MADNSENPRSDAEPDRTGDNEDVRGIADEGEDELDEESGDDEDSDDDEDAEGSSTF